MRKQTNFMRFFVLISVILMGMQVFGQEMNITGSVTDGDNHELMPGVTVQVKGTTTGAVTSIDGDFSVKSKVGDVLIFSFIGYASQEVTVASTAPLKITLAPDAIGLNDVVVIGYGTVKKSDATGAITTVGSKDFNKGAITSPQELLMGKSAGVNIVSATGAPGASSQIRIRGGSSISASNDPLYVIDGLPVGAGSVSGAPNPLNSINPNDIESFTVLKDASATAIYGSRASNGVIIITTKKGKAGKPLAVDYNGNISVGVPTKSLDVFNGSDYVALVKERVAIGSTNANALTEIGGSNTDWQDQIYRTAISSDNNVSITGSTKTMPYRGSVGYTDQNGILEGTSMKRTSASFGVDPTFFDKHLTVSLNAKGANTKNNFGNTDAIGRAVQFDPSQPIQNGNTRYGGYTAWTIIQKDGKQYPDSAPINIATHNPVASFHYRDNTSTVNTFIGNAAFDYKFHFMPELRANLNLGTDRIDSKGDNVTNPLASWAAREPEKNVEHYTQKRSNDLLDFYLNYTKELGVHKVDATGGYSWQHFYNEGTNSHRPLSPNSTGVFVNADTTLYKNENYLVSFFGRVNYTAFGRYLVTVTVRDDGSSRFAEAERWGLFPSAALAWKVKDESFLQDVTVVSDLKIRAGYGVTGQQNLQNDMNYPYIPVYTLSEQGASYQMGYNADGTPKFIATQRPGAYDPSLKWESTTTMNVGLDFGFIDNRLTGSVDLYARKTDDLINEIPVAAGTNFSNYLLTNVGSLENNGVEFSLIGRPISNQVQNLEIGFNFSANRNKITQMTRVTDPSYAGYATGDIAGGVGNKVQMNNVGHPINSFYLFKQVYNSDGMPIEGLYVDKTGQGGTVTASELNKYYTHSPAPEFVMGLSARYNYKKFDASFSGRLSVGNYVYNNNASNMALYQNLYNQAGYTSNVLTDVKRSNFQNAQYFSDFYLENASFFRMDNINCGYTFSKIFTEKLSGRLSFSVQNAFVITKYTGIDPEVENGIDNAAYPRPRTYMLGVSLNL